MASVCFEVFLQRMELQTIPVFPLQLVVFEGESLKLHIFEPRYKSLINDCIGSKGKFGIPSVINQKLQPTGGLVSVLQVLQQYDNGEMDVSLFCHSRFYISEFFASADQSVAASAIVQEIPFTDNEDKELNLRLTDLIQELIHLNDSGMYVADAATFQFYKWIHKCGLSLDKELEMAELTSTSERQVYLVEHLKSLIGAQTEILKMRKMIQLNGHIQQVDQSF